MNEEVNQLIEALREELTQYGELLALMQEQQELIIDRQPQELDDNVSRVNAQMEKIANARDARHAGRTAVTGVIGAPDDITFHEMTDQLPEEYRPLLVALMEEINMLLKHIQKWLRQNHLLLQRSLELMGRLFQGVFPQTKPKTYSRTGYISPVNPPPSSLYEGLI
ncbi:MAG: flagellar protein FlgN [Verrucomicrobiota bacterium]|nr:flagellar protein FlgN [Verrucomicrobiota bacterium]